MKRFLNIAVLIFIVLSYTKAVYSSNSELMTKNDFKIFTETVNKRFDELRSDMNKRFDELRSDMNKRFDFSSWFSYYRSNVYHFYYSFLYYKNQDFSEKDN